MIEVTEVRTNDAAPVDPPHRISAQPGHDTAAVSVAIASTGQIRAWRLEPGDAPRDHEPMQAGGVVCGLDRCGQRAPLRTDSLFPLRLNVRQAELGAEGDYILSVHAASREEGWL